MKTIFIAVGTFFGLVTTMAGLALRSGNKALRSIYDEKKRKL